MKPEQLGNIAKLLGGSLTPDEASAVYAAGVSVDTRMLNPGDIFFALIGARDGHDFAMDAHTRGATCAVVQRLADVPLPQIIVKDTLRALGDFAAAYRSAMTAKIVAVTGSVGKTGARDMIAAALRTKLRIHSPKLNYNNLIGLPLTLLEMQQDTEICVVELGINQPGEMARLAEIARPDAAIITAIAPVHTEGLAGIEGIMHEKLKIIDGLSQNAPLFINIDSEPMQSAKINHPRVITYGISKEADFRAENIGFVNGRPTFEIKGVKFEMNILGKAPIYAALSASAVAGHFGIPIRKTAHALKDFTPQPHRMQLLQIGGISVLDDSYNSSPLALEEAIETMMRIPAKRRIAILGDMLELGELAEKYHCFAGEMITEKKLDGAVLFGKLMCHAFVQAKAMKFGGELFWTEDFAEAHDMATRMVRRGDIVLVKGSHSMGMERFVQRFREISGKEMK